MTPTLQDAARSTRSTQVVPEADPAEGRQPQRADERRAQEGGRESDRLAAIRQATNKSMRAHAANAGSFGRVRR